MGASKATTGIPSPDATEANTPPPRDYITAFANAIALFGSPDISSEIFTHIPSLLVAQFGAVRSELWLWDESSGSAYLTNVAGQQGYHRRDYSTAGVGAIGRVLGGQKPLYGASLANISDEDREFAASTGLSHVTAFPLLADAKLVGVTAIYSRAPESKDLLQWWELFSQVAAVTLKQILANQQDQKTVSRLSLLFEATRLLNSTLDLVELLELILKIARSEVSADRGTIFLVDSQKQELWSIFAQGVEKQEIRLPFGRGVAGRVATTGELINVHDAYTLEYFDSSFDKKFGYKTTSLLCLPIRHTSGDIVGVLQLLNQNTSGFFSSEDEAFLTDLSGHMAMALDNARLHRSALEEERAKRELEMAQGIQRSLLPDAAPIVPGYDLAVFSETCDEVGGDYYDFILLDSQTLVLVMADVQGKGLPSVLAMSKLQDSLRSLSRKIHSLEVLTRTLNSKLCSDPEGISYVSLFLGLIDMRRNGLHYINAGHTAPLWISGETGVITQLRGSDAVMGLFFESSFSRESCRLQPGDVLVCCADGVIHACNRQGEEYGIERLSECVTKYYRHGAEDIVHAVQNDLKQFCGDMKMTDDRGMIILKVMRDRPTD